MPQFAPIRKPFDLTGVDLVHPPNRQPEGRTMFRSIVTGQTGEYICRTTDITLVRRILTDPRVYGKMADDFAPPREQYEPLEHPEMIYLAVNGDQGVFALVPHSRIVYEVHTCLLPVLFGAQALEAAAALLTWVWANTICERLITSVPHHNRTALRFAQKAGLEIYGTNPRAFMKNGRLENIVMLGISRPKVGVS